MQLVMIKEKMDTCNRNTLRAAVPQKQAAGGRRLCLTLTSSEATGRCRRFPLLQISSEQILPCQGIEVIICTSRLGLIIRKSPEVQGHSNRGRENTELNKVVLVIKENSRWELKVKECKLGSPELPHADKISLLILSSSSIQSAE